MPEEQTPFIHENGTVTPEPGERFSRQELAAQIATCEAVARYLRGRANFYRIDAMAAAAGAAESLAEKLLRGRDTLTDLQQPVFSTTLAAMIALEPSEAALVNQLAIALLDAGNKRHKLIAAVRRAMDEVGP